MHITNRRRLTWCSAWEPSKGTPNLCWRSLSLASFKEANLQNQNPSSSITMHKIDWIQRKMVTSSKSENTKTRFHMYSLKEQVNW
jgi:hypothetical protein